MNSELEIVKGRIKRAILAFTAHKTVFRADQLRAYVAARCGSLAPASADRVLRDLRQKGKLNYRVVNRRKSLYRLVPTEVDS